MKLNHSIVKTGVKMVCIKWKVLGSEGNISLIVSVLSPYWKIKYLLYSAQDVRSILRVELIIAKILTLRLGTEVRPEGCSVAAAGWSGEAGWGWWCSQGAHPQDSTWKQVTRQLLLHGTISLSLSVCCQPWGWMSSKTIGFCGAIICSTTGPSSRQG